MFGRHTGLDSGGAFSKTMRPAATRTAAVSARARMQWADRARHRGAKSLLGKSHTHLLLLMAMTLSHHSMQSKSMWETTFPRNSHAGLGRRDFTAMHSFGSSMIHHANSVSTKQLRNFANLPPMGRVSMSQVLTSGKESSECCYSLISDG